MKDIQKLLKNPKVMIVTGVVVLVLIVGLVMMVMGKSNSASNQAANAQPTQVPVLTLQPEDIGLTFVPDQNLQKGLMTITKVSDISTINYQFSYTALVSGQPILRGTMSSDIKPNGQDIKQEMVFGTCSDVCHYDTGISDIKIIVKVTKTDGKIYSVELSVPVAK